MATAAPARVLLAASALLPLTGCRARQLGQYISPTRADAVDAEWITATRNCWPALREASTTFLAGSLADPHDFRGAFPTFALQSDAAVESIAEHGVAAAPAADFTAFRQAAGPLLTRAQAITPQFAADTNAPHAHDATASTLCAVHTGSPVGFR